MRGSEAALGSREDLAAAKEQGVRPKDRSKQKRRAFDKEFVGLRREKVKGLKSAKVGGLTACSALAR